LAPATPRTAVFYQKDAPFARNFSFSAKKAFPFASFSFFRRYSHFPQQGQLFQKNLKLLQMSLAIYPARGYNVADIPHLPQDVVLFAI